MSSSEETTLRLVSLAYDAALDEKKWSTFLEFFAQAVGGKSAFLRASNYELGLASFTSSVGYDPAWQSAYSNYFINHDYYAPFLKSVPLNAVSTDENRQWVISRPVRKKTEFYNDYNAPLDNEYAMATVLARDGNHMLQFCTQRGKRAGAFGANEVQLMSVLAPHVSRSVQIHRKISGISVEKEWALGALDQLRLGVILTNASGVPLFLNRAAELLLATASGINTKQCKLALSRTADTARLYQLIRDAAQGVPGTTMGGDMRITLPNGEFLHCLVAPIPIEFSARWNIPVASGCVALFMSQPSGLQLSPHRLAVMYGLTLAEAKVAAKLAALRSLEQAAAELNISINTARSQLKSVFAKTGAQSQSELLMLLATGALAHGRDKNNE